MPLVAASGRAMVVCFARLTAASSQLRTALLLNDNAVSSDEERVFAQSPTPYPKMQAQFIEVQKCSILCQQLSTLLLARRAC
jgi:hypothetical protein